MKAFYGHSSLAHSIIKTIITAITLTPFKPSCLTKADVICHLQVSENAKQDLKDGLALYNSENNIGLRNAWNIIQAEVGGRHTMHYIIY